MKTHLRYQMFSIVAIAVSCLLGSCDSKTTVNNTAERETSQPKPTDISPSKPTPSFQLGLFTIDELFAAGGGGCGMTLFPVSGEWDDPNHPGDTLLFHGIDESPMLMKVNGEMMAFELEDSSGEAFYGQKTRQTFSNAELGLTVSTDVRLGEVGEIESVAIAEGTVSISGEPEPVVTESDSRSKSQSQTIKAMLIAVEGDAGC